jgi:hypothetical protein
VLAIQSNNVKTLEPNPWPAALTECGARRLFYLKGMVVLKELSELPVFPKSDFPELLGNGSHLDQACHWQKEGLNQRKEGSS